MYLCTVHTGEQYYKSIPIVLMFRDLASKSSYHSFVEYFGSVVSLRVISHCGEVPSAKKTAYYFDEFEDGF